MTDKIRRLRIVSKRTSKPTALAVLAHTFPTQPRRAGETDAEHALRDRHFHAVQFARWALAELEAGETPSVDDRVIVAMEVARRVLRGDGDARLRIGAVRDALEHARRWELNYQRTPMREGEVGTPPVEPDLIRDEAGRVDPALQGIPIDDWKRAIAAWPGLDKPRGGPPGRVTWSRVVFDLLKPHGLTDATTPKALASAFGDAPKKQKRPSRAKT